MSARHSRNRYLCGPTPQTSDEVDVRRLAGEPARECEDWLGLASRDDWYVGAYGGRGVSNGAEMLMDEGRI